MATRRANHRRAEEARGEKFFITLKKGTLDGGVGDDGRLKRRCALYEAKVPSSCLRPPHGPFFLLSTTSACRAVSSANHRLPYKDSQTRGARGGGGVRYAPGHDSARIHTQVYEIR